MTKTILTITLLYLSVGLFAQIPDSEKRESINFQVGKTKVIYLKADEDIYVHCNNAGYYTCEHQKKPKRIIIKTLKVGNPKYDLIIRNLKGDIARVVKISVTP